MKNKSIIVIVSAAIIGMLFVVAASFYKKSESQRVGFLAAKDASLFVRPYSPRFGDENAKVFLVEFLDPECESCREFYPFVKELLKEFDGKVQLVVRYAPFHGNSVFVIKILEAARKQGKYWETLNLLFETQPSWGGHHHPQPELIWQYLPNIGIDNEKIRADLEDPKTMEIVTQDRLDGSQLGIRGTPTFFINGKVLESFGREELREALRREVESSR